MQLQLPALTGPAIEPLRDPLVSFPTNCLENQLLDYLLQVEAEGGSRTWDRILAGSSTRGIPGDAGSCK